MNPLFTALLVGGLFTALTAQAQHLPDAPTLKLPGAPSATNKFPGNDLKGIGAVDNRAPANQNEMPWRAVGRLRSSNASCTAAVVGPALVLTAAHCMFNNQSRKFFAPGELTFQLGYSDGKFAAEAKGVKITMPEDYDGILGIGSMGKDWALVQLDHAVGTPDIVLPLREMAPQRGAEVSLGGYAKDHIEVLLADQTCHVTGIMSDRNGIPMLRHDCSATHGVSGAPLLVHDPKGWTIGGIEVVGGDNGGGATVVYDAREAMEKMKK